MLAPLNIAGIVIIAYNQVCCNHCRFCSVGKKRFDDISFSQFVKVMERFLEWKEQTNKIDTFAPFILYTHCISIRLAYKKNGYIRVQSGAGIVADSIPENEFQECLNKAGAVLQAVETAKGGLE